MATAAAAASPTLRRRAIGDLTSVLAQDVTHAAHRVEQAGPAAGLGLSPEVSHVHPEGVGGGAEVVAPHRLEDLRAGQHLPGMLEEQLQQQELGLGQIAGPVAALDLVGGRVQHQVGVDQDLAVGSLAGPAEQRPEPRLELLERERLDQVVVGAHVQAGDAVVDRVPGGEHQDGGAVTGPAHAPRHLQAVHAGHGDVQNHRAGRRRGPRQPRFVVQEHHATRLHWDLRLEHDGGLASWAIPNGIPPDPAENRLAVRTEDHPLEYLEFSGEIPKGQYGAGTMTIWDSGTFELHKWDDKKVEVTFHGQRLKGRYGRYSIAAADASLGH